MNIKEIYNQHPYKEIMLFSGLLEVPTELYQRKLDHDRANRIAENFDPRLLNDPKVSERDGHFYVFDGQHTIEALRILNNSKELSIRIRLYQHMTAKDEAMLFAKQFGDSESVSAGAKMRALIFAENAEAVAFYNAVQKVGFDLDYSHVRGNNRIGCIAAAFREFQRLDADCFYEVLTLIRDAWDGDAESFRSEVFTALCRFVVQYRGEYDRHRLISRLRMAGPMDIYDGGRNVSNAELPGELKYIYQVLKIYNGTSATKTLPWKF